MIRVLLLLIAVLGGVPVLRAQTRSFQVHSFVANPIRSTGAGPTAIGRPAQNALRIRVPRIAIQPVAPGNFIGQNDVNPYRNAYGPTTPLTSVRQSSVQQPRNLSNDPNPVDHLNGLLLSRNPQAQSNHLNFPLRSDVRYSNREVANVQQNLRRLGYYSGMVDGISGPETKAAVRNYQAAHDPPVTGLLDSSMLSQLGIVTPSR